MDFPQTEIFYAFHEFLRNFTNPHGILANTRELKKFLKPFRNFQFIDPENNLTKMWYISIIKRINQTKKYVTIF